MKKLIALLLCAVMLVATSMALTSCGRAPEFSEIEGRIAELIEASYEINEIFFGEGLPTYERVNDPQDNLKTLREEGSDRIIYYYEIHDEGLGRVIKYRVGYRGEFTYVQVLTAPDPTREAVYANEEEKAYAYVIPYTEKEYDYYYKSTDPHDYDFVRHDAKYISISAIKEQAEKVYSKDYLSAVYLGLFEGTPINDNESLKNLSARYYEHTSDDGSVTLMKSNTYKPLVTEKRIFDLSTAEIVRPKRRNFVTVSVESYLESQPQNRETIRLTMILQDGVWMLDSGTY